MAVAALATALGGGLAVAADDSRPRLGPSYDIRTADPGAPLATERGEKTLAALARTMRVQERERDRALDAPALLDERRQSRTAYRGLDDAAARALLLDVFGSALTGSTARDGVLPDAGVVRFVDERTALTRERGGSAPVLVESDAPLGVADADGRIEPVDTTLNRRGNGFAPVNTVADVSLPGALGEGAMVGDLRVVPAGRSTGVLASDREHMTYPNALLDTDVILKPLVSGAEVLWQLRSPQAPEQLVVELGLPTGAVLRQSDDGLGAMVIGGDGVPLTAVSPPTAVDAQGRDVPVRMSAEDDRLLLAVDHRSADVAYPILVDPVIEDWLGGNRTSSWYHGQGYDGLDEWTWATNQSNGVYVPRTDCYAPVSCYKPAGTSVPPFGRGLYTYVRPLPWLIAGGAYGEWVYRHPGETTQVAEATLGPTFYRRRALLGQNPFPFMGIWMNEAGDWTDLRSLSGDVTHDFTTLTAGGLLPNSGSNSVAVGFYSPSLVTLLTTRDFAVGGATIALTDPEAPTISDIGHTGPSDWANDAEFSVAPTAHDPGLGVKRLRLEVPVEGGTTAQTRTHPCTGRSSDPCPSSWSLPDGALGAFAYATTDGDPETAGDQPVAEGIRSVRVVADDALGQASTAATATIKVDRGAPTLELSGELWDARDPGAPLDDGIYRLAVEGADAAAGPGPEGVRAGVEELVVRVDGDEVATALEQCGEGSCSMTLTWDLDTAEYEPGAHDVEVAAVDGAGNVETESFTIAIAEPAPDAPPLPETDVTPLGSATEFIYTGPNPLQNGVEEGTIEAERAAVVRGRVRSRSGDPLGGVTVSVVGRPELGTTASRADGEFFMAVNGGSDLTVRLERDGHIPVDRQVDVPWQDYVWIDDVVMTPVDSAATVVDLSGPLSPVQTARGAPVTDADGSRQATLIFPVGTGAEMVMPDGTPVPLDELTVRATEYTVGPDGADAMPAELPPTSGYTYAAEFSVDEAVAAGATEVRFSQPVVNYTENFLGFPVGEEVPTGYYDRRRAAWVGAPNGRVVGILAEEDGEAVLDVTGSGDPATPAQLAALGVSVGELSELAALYDPGNELWRVAIEHFSPWDHNWPWAPPPDADPPRIELPPPLVDESCTSAGSVIECDNQVLGEDLPITGSEQALHYRSDRVPGRLSARQVDIPLVPESYPAELESVQLIVEVAGQRFERSFEPEPGLSFVYEWDGRDGFGRKVNGAQPATIEIVYSYGLVEYRAAADWDVAWGRVGGAALIARTRENAALRQTLRTTLGGYEPPPSDLGGWTLGSHHRFDPIGKVLHLGEGRRRSAHNIGLVTERAAGDMSGDLASTGDGGSAREATFGFPEDVAVGADGSLYFTDSNNARIRKVDPDGIITTIAGTGDFRDYGDPAGDGGPATEAELDYPYGIDVAADGSVYFSDWNRIRRIDPNGVITTVAGKEVDGNDPAFGGDGGPATEAHLDAADAVAVAPDGSFYFVDYFNDRVRHVGSDGIVTTVAGTGVSGYGGDGGPAVDAQLSGPEDLAIGPDGSLYIADEGNARIRKVGPDGVIETVAGNGDVGTPTWGVDATVSAVEPQGIAVDARGALLVTIGGRTVGLVDGDGVLRKVAGTECSGPDCELDSSDGVLAPAADIGCPWGIAAGPAEDVFVTEMCDHTVRRLKPALPGFDGSDIAIPSVDGGELFRFDATGRHLETRAALTGAVRREFSYDAEGRLTEVVDGDGLTTTIERDQQGRPTGIEAPFGRVTTLTASPGGYIATVENPAGEVTSFGYGTGGLLASMLEPGGGESVFDYDSAGRLVRDTDPGGGFKELSWTTGGQQREITLETKLGRKSVYSFDSLDDGDTLRGVTDPSGLERTLRRQIDGTDHATDPDGSERTTTMSGDPRFGMQAPRLRELTVETPAGLTLESQASRLVTLDDPADPLSLTELEDTVAVNGRESSTVFDAALDRFTTTSPEGRHATVAVDSQTRPLETTIPGLEGVSYERDTSGRVEEITQGDRTTSFSYDQAGRLDTATDAAGRTRGYDFDGADRLVRETLPDLREIAYDYDEDGNLVSVTPPSRPAHAFGRTPVGLVESYTPPDLGGGAQPTQFDYNDDHDLTKITKPGGREIAFSYDPGGRLERVAHSRGAVELSYSPATGSLHSVEAPGGERTELDWDGFLPTGETVTGSVSGAVSRTFDDDLRIASESVNGSQAVSFGYDDDGLLTDVGPLSLARDGQNGLLVGATLGQVDTAVDRDGYGAPDSVSSQVDGAVVYAEDYVRDDLGRIVEKVERRGATATNYAYTYDSAGRLETVSADGQVTAAYSYDANGNRVAVERAGDQPVTGTYDDQDRMTAYGSATYTYDDAGQLESRTGAAGTTTHDYDDLGALTAVALADGTDIEYSIDGSGRRIGKTVDGTPTQKLLYGRDLGPAAELAPGGAVLSRFVYGTRTTVPDYMVRGGVTYRIVTDQLGSPRAVVDTATGAIVQEIDYDEFGRVLRDTNPGFQPFGYAGGIYDADTGLVRFGARDYDPETGRWTAKDPIGFAGGDTNLYGYVLNDPINMIDPQGLIGLPGFVEDGFSAATDVIDTLSPDSVSEFSAGVLDGALFGLPSNALDIDASCWGGAHLLGGVLAPGPGKFAKGFRTLGISKTIKIDRNGQPIPEVQLHKRVIGDSAQARRDMRKQVDKLGHTLGTPRTQDRRTVLDGAREALRLLQDVDF